MDRPTPVLQLIDHLATAPYHTYAMYAAIDLDIFTQLSKGPMDCPQLAAELGLDAKKLRPLLYVLASIGLLSVDAGRFANSAEADHFLVRTKPTFLGVRLDMYRQQQDIIYTKTAASIRSGKAQAHVVFGEMGPEEKTVYYESTWAAVSSSAKRVLAARRDRLERGRHLLDAGGGIGGFSITLTQALPSLRATIFDLPSITPLTQQFVDRERAQDRVQVVSGNLVTGPIPGRFDLAVSRACLQVLPRSQVRQAILNIGEAVEPGGTFFIIGAILDDSRQGPPRPVGYNLLALNIYEDTEAYTAGEYQEWLAEAGFGRFELAMDDRDRMLIAEKL